MEYVAFEQQLFVTGVEPAFADILAAEAEHAVRFVVAFVATTEIPAPVVAFGAFVVGIPEEVAEVFGFEAVDIVAGWVEQAVESDELGVVVLVSSPKSDPRMPEITKKEITTTRTFLRVLREDQDFFILSTVVAFSS